MKQQIEWLLFKSGITNYKIAQATGISQVVLGKYTNGVSDVGRMQLDNAEAIFKYFKEVLSMAEKQFGTAEFEGKEYILTEDAYPTNRVINNSFNIHEVADGEEYNFEMAARAVDHEGSRYTVYWIFWNVKGEDGKDLDDFDYSKANEVESL